MVGVPIPLFLFSLDSFSFLFLSFLCSVYFFKIIKMNSITEDNSIQPLLLKLDNSTQTKIRSERAFVLSQFLEEINKERLGTKFKPMTGRAVAIKLSHLKDNGTLYYFLSTCRDYKNRHGSFSKYFFGALKIR